MSEQSLDVIEQLDPEDDPFACSLCGCYLATVERVTGQNQCVDCRSKGRPLCPDSEHTDKSSNLE